MLGMSAALFFVVLAGAVTIQAQRIEAQHRIDALDARLLAADEQHRVLRAEVAVAASPERVMQAAAELGMVEPGPVLPLVPPAATDAPPAVGSDSPASPAVEPDPTEGSADAEADTGAVALAGEDSEETAGGG
jgi:hypothetical protein